MMFGDHLPPSETEVMQAAFHTSERLYMLPIGGLRRWSCRSYRLGQGLWMVIEGDEYSAAFFDREPKFLHYRPRIFLLGQVEFDRGDPYRDLDAVLTAFRAGTAQVPRHGAVVVNGDSESALSAVRDASAEVITVDSAAKSTCWLGDTDPGDGTGPTVAPMKWHGRHYDLRLPLVGRHNAENAALAYVGAVTAGLSQEDGS